MSAQMLTTLAVLIDAQNVPSAYAEEIFCKVNTLGTTSVRRIYGDWSNSKSGGWKAKINEHALRPMQQFSHVIGKDVADMALIIDAMDLLHSGNHAAFCIVSSDSDFAGLAVRVREQGIKVFGIGEAKSPQSFREACDRFVVLKKAPAAQVSSPADATARIIKLAISKGDGKSLSLPSKAPLSAIDLDDLRQAIKAKANDEGWSDMAVVGSYLTDNTSFETRKHAVNLSKLLRASSIADVEEFQTERGTRLRVKLRGP